MNRGAALLLAVFVVACGGSTAAGPVATSAVLDDFTITPGQLSVDAGAEVTIDVSNVGGIAHSFAILAAGERAVSGAAITDDQVLTETRVLAPGESETVTFSAPASGNYQIVCRVPGHLEAAMTATLRVGG